MSLFFSRKIELEIETVKALVEENPMNRSLCRFLLCIWNVTPSLDYVRSLSDLFVCIREHYSSPSFYDTFFRVQHTEGISILHYFLILVFLYLTDTRSVSITLTPLSPTILSQEQWTILLTYCAFLEIRSQSILESLVLFFSRI